MRLRYPFASLRTRLLVLLAAALLPALALIIYDVSQTRSEDLGKARASASRVASLAAKEIEAEIQGVVVALAAIAADPDTVLALTSRDEAAVADVLSSLTGLVQFSSLYSGGILVDAQGDLVAGVPMPDSPINYADRAWFQQLQAGAQVVIGPAVTSRLSGLAVLPVIWRITDRSGQLLGATGGAIGLEALADVAHAAELPAGGVFTVISGEGQVVARYPDPDSWLMKDASRTELAAFAARTGVSGALSDELVGLDGLRRLYAATRLSGAGSEHVVLVGMPTQTVAGAFVSGLAGPLGALALVVVIFGVGVWWASSRVVARPLRGLAEAAHKLGEGDLGARVPSRDLPRELEGLALSFNDMAASLEAKDAELQSAEIRHLTLLELSPSPSAVVGADGSLVYVNRAFAHLLGYEGPEALQGISVSELLHPGAQEQMLSGLDALFESDQSAPLQGEVQVIRKDGSVRDLLATAIPTSHKGQAAVQVVAVDQTERKHMEEALRLTQLSVDKALDMIIWIGRDGRLLYANEAYCRRTGYSKEELLGMTIFDFDPDLLPEAWPGRWEQDKKRGSVPFEVSHRTKEGEMFPLEVIAHHLAWGGEEVNVGAARDISERKQAEEALRASEEQLRQSQKMEAVGQLAGGIAHDFNNLLTAILGHSELLLADKDPALDRLRPDLEDIKRAGERASALTRQILAFSRRQALRPRVISLNEVLSGMEPLLRRTLGEHIDLISRQDPDLGSVEVDVHQFEQVLMNLALNARDAMTAGGRLTVETGNIQLDEDYCRTHPEVTPGSYVMLAVSDTGIGMDEVTRGRIFEPFFTTKPLGEGTGLGLAMVYGTVKQSGGSISVYSEPGRGTSFKIYLPRVHAAREEVPRTSGRASSGGTETILVVEDEASVRSLAGRILGAQGYRVLSTGTAEEALELFGEADSPPDLLLTDVVLPGVLQGRDLASELLKHLPDLPVIYMSGYARNAIVHAGRVDEGVNFLEKPFSPEALADMVREVLEHAGPN